MSARIKQLEDALADAQNGPLPFAALGDEPAPQSSLQDGEPSDVKYEGDTDSVSKSLGSLAIDGEGKAQYYGETAGAEVRPLSSLDPCLSPADTSLFATVSAAPHANSSSRCLASPGSLSLSGFSGRKLKQAIPAPSRSQGIWACPTKFWNLFTPFRSGLPIVLT
jgi:hypothetical protein